MHDTAEDSGTEMMVAVLKGDGTLAWERELLRVSVDISDSWCTRSFRTQPETPSGPAALRGLTFRKGPPDIVHGDAQKPPSLGECGAGRSVGGLEISKKVLEHREETGPWGILYVSCCNLLFS